MDEDERLIREATDCFQPLRGGKTILGRSEGPFKIWSETFTVFGYKGEDSLCFKALIRIQHIHPPLSLIASTCCRDVRGRARGERAAGGDEG